MATERSFGPRADALAEDRLLVERIRGGDELALRLIIRKYGKFVQGRAGQILGLSPFVEEVAQDTFLALWLKPESFDGGKGSLKTFLLSIAKHKAIDVLRHEQIVHDAESESSADGSLRVVVDNTGESTPSARVQRALGSLSPLQKEAIHLAYFERLTRKQVADQLQIPHSTAKTRVRDGLIALRTALNEATASKQLRNHTELGGDP